MRTSSKALRAISHKRRRGVAIALIVILSLALPSIALAHPLGNFTINHYAGLRLTSDAITIDYVLDMAEIPAFQEISSFDANQDGRPDEAETAGYHPAQCESIRSKLDLRVDGRPTPIVLASSSIEFPAGAGGLVTLRLTCAFGASNLSLGQNAQVEFKDSSYADRLGWREIVVAGDGVSVQGDFASTSISQRLTAYPDDMLSSPLDQREVRFNLGLAPSSQPAGPLTTQLAGSLTNRNDAFTQLITMRDLSPLTFLFALAVSFVWGAMHAMSPGHGKTVVAAYLVGTRGTTRQAVVLGLTVTLTHTVGVFVLGLVTLFASNYILPEQLFPWLSLASGVLVLGIGLTLLITRYRAARSGRGILAQLHRAIDSDRSRDHQRNHVHDDSAHAHDHGHDHAHGGSHSHYDHGHDHDHSHEHDRDHSRHTHTHSPLDESGRMTMRSLLALGISGGLIPCPTALVVLLSAIALGRVGFGLTLIVAFSAGLAAVLMVVGLLFVHGRRLFDRLPTENRLVSVLPFTGAALVILTGVVMTAQALASVGRLSV
jgi:ABC-type nickel/cobalt efflux system permease component RcnA